MRGYTQLTREQRYQIYVLWKNGFNQSEIALEVGVHKSTISREMKRNALITGDYVPARAHEHAQKRKTSDVARGLESRTNLPVVVRAR